MRRGKSVFDVLRTEVFKRSGPAYYDDFGNITTNYQVIDEPIYGDLQIYKLRAFKQIEAPTGYTLQGAFYFSTMYEFNTLDQVTATPADIMEKDGRIYYFWCKLAGGTGGPLFTDRYNQYALLLQDLPNEGAP